VSCDEILGNTGGIDNRATRNFVRKFHVVTNDATDDAGYVLANGSCLPAMFSPYITAHFTDAYSYVVNREAEQTDRTSSGCKFVVTINYKSPEWPDLQGWNPATGNMDQTQTNPDPTARGPKWRLTFQRREVPVQYDLDGYPILNAALQPFIPPVMWTTAYTNLRVTKNYATVDFQGYRQLFQTINNATWNGCVTGTVLLDDVSFSDAHFENGISYVVVEYSFLINYATRPQKDDLGNEGDVIGWEYEYLLNQGYAELASSGTMPAGVKSRWRTITDSRGQPLSHQTLLDKHGKQLEDYNSPTYSHFRKYQKASFSALP